MKPVKRYLLEDFLDAERAKRRAKQVRRSKCVNGNARVLRERRKDKQGRFA